MKTIQITAKCQSCGLDYNISVDYDGYVAWKNREGLIQDLLPDNTVNERELLISGICGDCYDLMFLDNDNEINKPDLENDLINCDWIREKCEKSESYSQNLYAALCNRIFIKDGERWTCSWRYAGGIVADLRSNKYSEDYLHWYCSGIYGGDDYIGEGDITGEIIEDLQKLGWEHESYE